MRTAADFFGLMVYLSVMYVALPEPELLSAAYNARDDARATGGRRGHLRVIEGGNSKQGPTKRSAKNASQGYESAA